MYQSFDTLFFFFHLVSFFSDFDNFEVRLILEIVTCKYGESTKT